MEVIYSKRKNDTADCMESSYKILDFVSITAGQTFHCILLKEGIIIIIILII